MRVTAPLFRLPAVALLPIVLATFAFAHAVLVGSSPSPDSTVKGPNVEISLKFNVRIDVARSRLELMLPGNTAERLPVREGKAANLPCNQSVSGEIQTAMAGIGLRRTYHAGRNRFFSPVISHGEDE